MSQLVAIGGVLEVVKCQSVHLLHRAGPVGLGAQHIHVRHDQKRRVFQSAGLLQELVTRLAQICALAILFPN